MCISFHSENKERIGKMDSVLSCISFPVGMFAGIIGVTYVIRQWMINMCTSKVRLDGKIVIVTGANTGIGIQTVIDLARRGATVIMACRNLDKSKPALEKAKKESGSNDIVLMRLDLSSLKSVREFAEEFLSKYSRLNILINNAGIMGCPYGKTEDGFEMHIGTNHFGHFVLTNLLLKALVKGAPARVVTVSSDGHRFKGEIHFDDINNEKRPYSKIAGYGQSKMANILFSRELHARGKDYRITTYSLQPGVVNTELSRHSYRALLISLTFGKLYGLTPVQGAQTTIYCAVEEGLEKYSGGYFRNCGVVSASAYACNDGYSKKLWELSEQMTNTKFPL